MFPSFRIFRFEKLWAPKGVILSHSRLEEHLPQWIAGVLAAPEKAPSRTVTGRESDPGIIVFGEGLRMSG